ncbi:MAG TPA: aldo/keto reductase [Verrucomicrobiales bacterium]|nr:aldo/keto reductase [Verrucomicrobiales bacterium]
MNYRRLGRANLQVSEVSLGTVELEMDYGIPVQGEQRRPSESEAVKLLNAAVDRGINFIDTARVYGESEAIVGRALKSRRNEIILATKVDHTRQERDTVGALRKRVETSVADSLRDFRPKLSICYIFTTLPSRRFRVANWWRLFRRHNARGKCVSSAHRHTAKPRHWLP